MSFSGFLTGFDYTALNIAMSTLSSEFHASYSTTSWVLLAYALIFVAGAIPASDLMRIYGLRRLMAVGFAIYAVGSALCVFAPSIVTLALFRAVQGLGGAILFVAGPALIRQQVPEGHRGQGYNVAVLAPTIGLCAGPALGGLILSALDWRWIFLVNLPVCAAGIWVLIARMKIDAPEPGESRMDLIGTGLLFTTLVSLVFAINQGDELGWNSVTILGTLGMSAISLSALVWRKTHQPSARSEIRALFQPAFCIGLLGVFLLQILSGGMGFLLPIYLQLIKSIPTAWAGAILSIQPVSILLLAAFAGQVAAWGSAPLRAQVGAVLTILSAAAMVGDTLMGGVVAMAVALLISGIGRGLGFPPVVQMTLDPVPTSMAVTASGTMTTARTMGQLIGIVVFETALSAYVGGNARHVTPTAQDTEAFRTIFAISLAVAGLALVAIRLQSQSYTTVSAEPR